MTDSLAANLLHDPGFWSRAGLPGPAPGLAGRSNPTGASPRLHRRARAPRRAAGGRDFYFFFALDFDFFFVTFLFTGFLWAFFAMFKSPSLGVVSPSECLFPRGRPSLSSGIGAL